MFSNFEIKKINGLRTSIDGRSKFRVAGQSMTKIHYVMKLEFARLFLDVRNPIHSEWSLTFNFERPLDYRVRNFVSWRSRSFPETLTHNWHISKVNGWIYPFLLWTVDAVRKTDKYVGWESVKASKLDRTWIATHYFQRGEIKFGWKRIEERCTQWTIRFFIVVVRGWLHHLIRTSPSSYVEKYKGKTLL